MLALLLNLGANVLDNARIDAVVNGKGLPRGEGTQYPVILNITQCTW